MISNTDADLLHGDADTIAAYLGITARQVHNYKTGKTPLPAPCRRLLQLRAHGDLSALHGDAWDGFQMVDGLMYLPGWRNGFDPAQIRALFFTQQECAALRAELKVLRSKVWAMQKVREAERSGGKAARLRKHTAQLQALCNLIALDVSDDGDTADDGNRNIDATV